MAHGKCKCRGKGIIETLKTFNFTKIYKFKLFRCRNGLLLNTEKNLQKDFQISTPKAFIIQKRSSTITEDLNRMQAKRKAFNRMIREKVRKLNQYTNYRRVTGKRSETAASPIENMKPINHLIMKNLLATTNLQRFVDKRESYSNYRRILGKRNIDSEYRNFAGIPILAERLLRPTVHVL